MKLPKRFVNFFVFRRHSKKLNIVLFLSKDEVSLRDFLHVAPPRSLAEKSKLRRASTAEDGIVLLLFVCKISFLKTILLLLLLFS
jgi:hypothetical protein